MNRSRLQLVLRDLSASAAFGTIAISGQVPSWAMAVFLVVLVLALAGKRPLSDGRLSALVLLVAVVLLYTAVVVDQLDLVVAA